MGRTSYSGPATGGVMVIPLDLHHVTGAPRASNDFAPPFWMRLLGVVGFWNGIGATTQVSLFTGNGGGHPAGATNIFASPHVPAATEMLTPDGLAHGAASAIPLPANCYRDTARSSAGGGVPPFDSEGDEVSLGLDVNGTFTSLAVTYHFFYAVGSHRPNPDNPSTTNKDYPYYNRSEGRP